MPLSCSLLNYLVKIFMFGCFMWKRNVLMIIYIFVVAEAYVDFCPRTIYNLQNHQISPSTMEEAMRKVIRGAQMIMQNAILLQHEVHQLCMKNKHQKQRQAALRAFIQAGGSLTDARGLQKVQEQKTVMKKVCLPVSRLCRPPT